MKESLLPGSRKRSVTLITYGALGMINADNANADRVAAAAPELHNLIPEIVYDPIYLLDHGLRENFYLNSDLHGRYWTPGHPIARIDNRGLAGDDFPEGAIATPSRYTPPCGFVNKHPNLCE
jgi:hypothetical protein